MAISRNTIISCDFVDFWPKNLFCIPYLGNLTTHIAITGNFVLCSSRFLMG